MSQCVYAQYMVSYGAYDSKDLVEYESCCEETDPNHQFLCFIHCLYCLLDNKFYYHSVAYFTQDVTIIFQDYAYQNRIQLVSHTLLLIVTSAFARQLRMMMLNRLALPTYKSYIYY